MEPERGYLRELVGRLQDLLGADLVGAYAGGSYVLGDYERTRSDLDVAAVVARRLPRPAKDAIVATARHESLPCPARGLELVVYGRGAEELELNLNSGRSLAFRVDFEPVADERHWFVIDRSVLARHGVALVGPPAAEVFGEPDRDELVAALRETLLWFARRESASASAVLNACRALRFASEGDWTSKAEAGTWALGRVAERRLVEEALAVRHERGRLDEPRVRAFLLRVAGLLQRG